MSGKSTYLRMIGILCVLSQCGLYVPCDSIKFTVLDNIFSRVGSIDQINKNESSFMSEMNQTSFILNNSNKNTLLLFDEIGRGTSISDGYKIAYKNHTKIHVLLII